MSHGGPISEHHQSDIEATIALMRHLRAGPRWLDDLVHHGEDAIPALQTLLFTREHSGLCQARCQAAQALAALKAFDVLEEFLTCNRVIDDPVERVGEDTVLSSVSSLVAKRGDEAAFDLLMGLAKHKHLRGVIEGLGFFRRPEAISVFIDALAHDELRHAAENALLDLGRLAKKDLMDTACRKSNEAGTESESSLRRRRSALSLLRDLRVHRQEWMHLRFLLHDQDRQISALACQICLKVGLLEERAWARAHLETLKAEASWHEYFQIDQFLGRSKIRANRREKESNMHGNGID